MLMFACVCVCVCVRVCVRMSHAYVHACALSQYCMHSNYSRTKLSWLEDLKSSQFVFSRMQVVTKFILHIQTIFVI